MKRKLILCVSALLLCACGSPGIRRADAVPAAHEGPSKWIDQPGDHRVGDTWVSVNAQDGKLKISHITTKLGAGIQSTSTSSSSPDGWRAHDGWFAFVQEDGRKVWVYDGRESLLLATWKRSDERSESSIYGPGNFPVPVPDAVRARLKEPFRSKVK
jgi:hypothetical protein